MTLGELIAEGEALSRPSWALRTQPTGTDVVAYWGGERSDVPNALTPAVTAYRSRRHLFTLGESLLAGLGVRQGPVSLFEWKTRAGETHLRVDRDPRLHFQDLRFSGEPLYATPGRSFPPFPALCLYGSSRVGEWLAGLGFTRDAYWQVAGDLEAGYTAEWNRRSVLVQNGVDLIVGGWHFQWPEDDFYMPPQRQLIALTLRDAEPWYEVWYSRPQFGFRARMLTS